MNFAKPQVNRNFIDGSEATKSFGDFVGSQEQVVHISHGAIPLA
jgi:hypothetical protein